MKRLFIVLVLTAAAALTVSARNYKLYMKDGEYHVVREHKVEGDRVRFYSVERGEWEEIPVALADLDRTSKEIAEEESARKEETAILAAEDKAEREMRREIERIPQEPGVYFDEGETVRAIKQAESKAVTNKGRSILKVLAPVPVITGKATVEVDGARSANVVNKSRPEFYFRLAELERFAMVRATPKKDSRVIVKWTIVPVTNEIVDEFEEVEMFRRQVAEGIYKVWPEQPLKPGEYAIIEYTEGKGNVQIWDFAYRP
ncbi:MAG: hypothetical protein KJZ78_12015 [Bryobacteraceae bacterium]|nr:hypothetical protein [Bryobacteraceae bacterium]